MNKRMFHKDFINSFDRFFIFECTIEEPVTEFKESGNPNITYTDKYVAIPSAFGKMKGSENREESKTYHSGMFRIVLKGYYGDITGDMRAKINTTHYNIHYAIPDSQHEKTSLVVELIKH